MDILEKLTKNELENIKKVHLNKGEILFSEGDKCLHLGIVKKGEMKIVSYLEDGKDVIYNVLTANQVFGINLIFSSDPFYRGDVVANKDSDVYIIEKDKLVKILQNNQDFLLAYLEEQSNFGKQLNLNIKLLTFKKAEDRIIYFLNINKNKVAYKSITDLANKLFLSREATSRELSRLEAAGIIKKTAKTIIKI